jgi:uncharacterized Fe-S cluster-containing radical SAM superfamily protein
MGEPITIAGLELTEERFPHLYRIAQTNPEGLEAQLRALDRLSGGKSHLWSAAINLEMDLAHG